MATQNSFADLMLDWKKVLSACADNAAELTTAEPQRAQVEKMFKEAQDLKAQQDSRTASKQATVQQLSDLLRDGREAVRRLRAMVKATLGTDNEALVQFGIAPNRKRGKKKVALAQKPPESPPPTAGPPAVTPAAHPETQ
jgi:hypothetical protein